MFCVLDLASNETIKSGKTNTISSQPANQQNNNKVNVIYGPLKRSRNGCMQCRKRKKKCNEEHPMCSSCKHRNVECTWRADTKFKILKESQRVNKSKRVPVNEGYIEQLSSSSSSDETEEVIDLPNQKNTQDHTIDPTIMALIQPIQDSIQNHSSMIRSLPFPFEDNFTSFIDFHLPSPMGSHIFQPFQNLDTQGLYFLDGFIANVASKFSIGHESTNYILKTFYQLSEENDAIAHALAAWGGIFLEGGFTDNVNHHLNKAISKISTEYPDMNNLSKKDVYVLLNYFMISIGLQICGGDVYKWNKLFNQSIELVKKCGGLGNIVKMFDCCNEIKWLLSDIQYHDVLSLQSFNKGTSLPMQEYNAIFKEANVLELGNYGLDPFQGCIQPIFLVLGEIIAKSVELNKKRIELENQEDMSVRLDFYNEMNECYQQLEAQIANCIPNVEQMNHIKDDRHEIELHLTLFDVALITCQICLNYLIKKLPAGTLEMQILSLKSLKQIDFLIQTKMKAAMSFILLVCGITCCTESDRQKMLERFKIVSQDYKAANVSLIRDIVQKVWERNDHGRLCVDWLVICEENNWDVSFC